MTSPVILHVPHASRAIPEPVREGIVLNDDDLEMELDRMTDSFTDVLAARAADAARVDAHIVSAPASRLVVDVERFTDGTEPMESVGMGPVYTATHGGRVLRDAQDPTLLDRFFHPHAKAIEEAVAAALAEHDRAVVIDVHSYPTHRLPYERSQEDAPRPEICLGTDPVHTPEWLLATARDVFASFEVGRDSPFAGAYVPLSRLHTDPRVSAIMVEIRRDQYMDEAAVALHAGVDHVINALAQLITACSDLPSPPPLVELARAIAIAAHRGQTDKTGVEYWRHPERVVDHLRRLHYDVSGEAVAAAWLHDVIEDTPWTASTLIAAGIPPSAVEAVVALARNAAVAPEDYYRHIRELGGIALMVKHADIADNTDPVRVAALEAVHPERAAGLRVRYSAALEALGLTRSR